VKGQQARFRLKLRPVQTDIEVVVHPFWRRKKENVVEYEPIVISGPNGTAPGENGEAGARKVRQPLLAVLASAGVASEEDLRSALAEGMDSGERLGEVVLRRGWLDEAGLARVLAEQWDLPFLEDASPAIDQTAFRLIAAEDARRVGAVAIGFDEGRPLVALSEPSAERLADVRSLAGTEVAFAVVTTGTLERLFEGGPAATVLQDNPPPSDPAELNPQLELVLELDEGITLLAGVRSKLEALDNLLQTSQRELAASQERLAALEAGREEARAQIEQLESDLARRDELLGVLKTKVVDFTSILELS
jgi:type II secretion system (T2SS) protein E